MTPASSYSYVAIVAARYGVFGRLSGAFPAVNYRTRSCCSRRDGVIRGETKERRGSLQEYSGSDVSACNPMPAKSIAPVTHVT